MSKNFRWFAAGFILFLIIIAAVVVFWGDTQSVIRRESVTASDVYRFSFISQSGSSGMRTSNSDAEIDKNDITDSDEVYYRDDFFDRPNSEYDHDLARASLALSMTAFKREHAESLMSGMSYEDIVFYRYQQKNDEDKVALVMGHKEITGTAASESTLVTTRDVIALAVRGGKYGDEWGSNGRVGYDGEAFGYHYGFHKAAEDAVVQLKEYAADNDLNLSESVIWITGFSRGAAVANVMGALLTGTSATAGNGTGVSLDYNSAPGDPVTILPENLFCYTFASPSTVSESLVTGNGTGVSNHAALGAVPDSASREQQSVYRGIYNIVNPLDIVTRLPMNASGISKTSKGKTVRYNWDYVRYGDTMNLPSDAGSGQLQMVQLLENALAFATRNEARYVEKTQDQVIIPVLKKTMGSGADISKRNVGVVLIDSLPGVATFLKNEVDQLELKTQIYVAGILSGKQSIRLEKEHWPETYWGWMMKVDELE